MIWKEHLHAPLTTPHPPSEGLHCQVGGFLQKQQGGQQERWSLELTLPPAAFCRALPTAPPGVGTGLPWASWGPGESLWVRRGAGWGKDTRALTLARNRNSSTAERPPQMLTPGLSVRAHAFQVLGLGHQVDAALFRCLPFHTDYWGVWALREDFRFPPSRLLPRPKGHRGRQ